MSTARSLRSLVFTENERLASLDDHAFEGLDGLVQLEMTTTVGGPARIGEATMSGLSELQTLKVRFGALNYVAAAAFAASPRLEHVEIAGAPRLLELGPNVLGGIRGSSE